VTGAFSGEEDEMTEPDRERFRLALTPLVPLTADVCPDVLDLAGETPDADSIAFAFCLDSDMESSTGPLVCLSGDPLSASGLELSSAVTVCDSLVATGRDESVSDASGEGMAVTNDAEVDAKDVSLVRDTWKVARD
jgi:hypothetical protein